MPLKKLFRAPRKFVRKVIPKEIRPFVPYIAAGMVGPAGLPSIGIESQGLSRALLAGLTRGVVDDEADFRDVLRTGVTAALPNIIESGSSAIAEKFGTTPETLAAFKKAKLASPGSTTRLPLSETIANKIGSIADSDVITKLTSGEVLNKPTSAGVIIAGSADQARKLIDDYEDGLDGPYDRKNDRGALFKIFEKAQWGTDDEINDMLDRYGYM